MSVIFVDDEEEIEEATPLTCSLCSAYLDGHWSTCPLDKGNADTDPDADLDYTVADRLKYD